MREDDGQLFRAARGNPHSVPKGQLKDWLGELYERRREEDDLAAEEPRLMSAPGDWALAAVLVVVFAGMFYEAWVLWGAG